MQTFLISQVYEKARQSRANHSYRRKIKIPVDPKRRANRWRVTIRKKDQEERKSNFGWKKKIGEEKKKGARDRESFLRVPMTEVRFNVGRAWGENRNFFVLYSLFFHGRRSLSRSQDKRETFLEINKYIFFFFFFPFHALHLPVKYKRQMSGGGGKTTRKMKLNIKTGGEREKFRGQDSDNGSFRLSPRATLIFMLPL